jgi:hypothetical protein
MSLYLSIIYLFFFFLLQIFFKSRAIYYTIYTFFSHYTREEKEKKGVQNVNSCPTFGKFSVYTSLLYSSSCFFIFRYINLYYKYFSQVGQYVTPFTLFLLYKEKKRRKRRSKKSVKEENSCPIFGNFSV